MKFLVLLFLLGFATANIHQEQEEEERTFAEFFNSLGNDIKEKYTKFKEWAADTFKKGLEKGASEIDNIKRIAKEFIENAENASKEVAHEAEEFFSKHKEKLGDIWDEIKNTVDEIKHNKPNQIKNTVDEIKHNKPNQIKNTVDEIKHNKPNQHIKGPVSHRRGRKRYRQLNRRKH